MHADSLVIKQTIMPFPTNVLSATYDVVQVTKNDLLCRIGKGDYCRDGHGELLGLA